MKKKLNERTFDELKETIDNEIEYVDVKPYSHNIISITLRQIDDKFGKKKVREVFDYFNLHELGWKYPE